MQDASFAHHPIALWVRVTITIALIGGLALTAAVGGAPRAIKVFWGRLAFWVLLLGIQAAWLWYISGLRSP